MGLDLKVNFKVYASLVREKSTSDKTWKIGQAARAAGVEASALRFYEKAGLIPRPERTEGRYRLYTGQTVERVRFIRKAQGLGLTLGEIRQILDLSGRGRCPCGHVEKLLQAKLEELQGKISDLKAVQSRIRAALRRSGKPAGRPTGRALCPTILESGKNNPREV